MKLVPALALCLLTSGCAYVKVIFQKRPDTAYATAETREAVLRPLDAEGAARWREANWRIIKAIRADHPDPWFRMSLEAFMAQVADLDRDLPRLSEYQVVLRWKRILATFGDGHTQLWERASWLRGWPVSTAFAGDSLVITSVANGQDTWLGARVLKVGTEPVEAFLDRVLRSCGQRPVTRVVLDLRGNGGGDERVSEPLLSWIRKHPAFSRTGGTIVLTDANTYSSGHGLARRLKRAGALIAGAETGQPENAFGQIHFTALPGLKPAFGCSTRRFLWDKGNPEAWRRGLLPDLLTEPMTEDVLGLSDTVLDRVLARPFPTGRSS